MAKHKKRWLHCKRRRHRTRWKTLRQRRWSWIRRRKCANGGKNSVKGAKICAIGGKVQTKLSERRMKQKKTKKKKRNEDESCCANEIKLKCHPNEIIMQLVWGLDHRQREARTKRTTTIKVTTTTSTTTAEGIACKSFAQCWQHLPAAA